MQPRCIFLSLSNFLKFPSIKQWEREMKGRWGTVHFSKAGEGANAFKHNQCIHLKTTGTGLIQLTQAAFVKW